MKKRINITIEESNLPGKYDLKINLEKEHHDYFNISYPLLIEHILTYSTDFSLENIIKKLDA